MEGRNWRVVEKVVGEISGGKNVSGKAVTGPYKGRKGGPGFFLGGMQRRVLRTRRPGNTSARDPPADRRFISPVLNFLRNMGVGKVKEGVFLSSGSP